MTTADKPKWLSSALVAAGAFAAVHLFHLVFPGLMDTWNERLIDRFFVLKAESAAYRATYDDAVVHVDLNNTSLRALQDFHPTRLHYARVIDNLGKMRVGVQMCDIIFAGDTSEPNDRMLMDATGRARDVVFGMAFRLVTGPQRREDHTADPSASEHLRKSLWVLPASEDAAGFYTGVDPLITLAPLAELSLGTGFLTLTPDPDGVIRRIPLLVHFQNGFYPSFVLKAVCAFFNVTPERVSIGPGAVTLQGAARPGAASTPHDIRIPVDARGRMRVHFVGPWGRMKHYHFSDIYFAADDPDRLEQWRDELSGKVALISDISTGSADMGQVPIDEVYPLSGVHANAFHTILSGAFLRELPAMARTGIEALLVLGVVLLSFHRSALVFAGGTAAMAAMLVGATGVAFVARGWIVSATQPLVVLLLGWASLTVWRAMEKAREQAEIQRAREVAERELEIGRRIQTGFLPASLPIPPGWDIAAYFDPARQVSGDFYDVFELAGGRYLVVVIADVCDHGVGSALYMALVRSLIRAFALQDSATEGRRLQDPDWPRALALRTVERTNGYVAGTHGDTGMFATLFIGVIDPQSGSMWYINCGHEPPVVVRNGQATRHLKASGLAIGVMPDVRFTAHEVRLETGDQLVLFTDGVADAESAADGRFTKERLVRLCEEKPKSATELVETVVKELRSHLGNVPAEDDITLVTVFRTAAAERAPGRTG